MKVKSLEWLEFKRQLISVLSTFEDEMEKFDFPTHEEENFTVYVDGVSVFPVFVKKENSLIVEYDFNLCRTKIRKLVFSTLFNTYRVEISLKNKS
jgi:hypothetical protein